MGFSLALNVRGGIITRLEISLIVGIILGVIGGLTAGLLGQWGQYPRTGQDGKMKGGAGADGKGKEGR